MDRTTQIDLKHRPTGGAFWKLDADGLAWITLTAPNEQTNIFSSETLDSFDQAFNEVSLRNPRAAIISSGQKKIFVAGADLQWLGGVDSPQAGSELARKGQEIFFRLRAAQFPIICAIHGAAVGGGLELALSSHWRMATDAPETKIGLPETSLGIIPGWGGCTFLPRLIGARAALDHILNAKLITGTEAKDLGIVDELTTLKDLPERAREAALRLAKQGLPVRQSGANITPSEYAELAAAVNRKTRGFLPAPVAAIEVVRRGFDRTIPEALTLEAAEFGRLSAGNICKNLLHAFDLREQARKRNLAAWFPDTVASQSIPTICRVGVVGAGVMGTGIAHWCAVRGFAVVMTDLNSLQVERGRLAIQTLLKESVAGGKLTLAEATAAAERVIGTTDMSAVHDCDLIIEAIVENIEAKRKLFREMAPWLAPTTMIASNTSALPIDDIFAEVPCPARTIGLHFFNPVNRMPLVELIVGRHTSPETAAATLSFAKALAKSPVICRSSPGFLVTRILFFYLNEACRLWEQGLSGESIDRALQNWGWPMGPLRLIDEVGIDVTDFIFGEMEAYFPGRFKRTSVCSRLLGAGCKGRKGGEGAGFYLYSGKHATTNEAPGLLMPDRSTAMEMPDELICDQLIKVMSTEATLCLREGVILSPDDVDFALLDGAGFPAFRGGLMRNHTLDCPPVHSERVGTTPLPCL
jgi:3-hydroxyacyl-CoA dehydrogenase/enoyl-CoA hydratase/3-hydroxybutyryl-CoA epimerase